MVTSTTCLPQQAASAVLGTRGQADAPPDAFSSTRASVPYTAPAHPSAGWGSVATKKAKPTGELKHLPRFPTPVSETCRVSPVWHLGPGSHQGLVACHNLLLGPSPPSALGRCPASTLSFPVRSCWDGVGTERDRAMKLCHSNPVHCLIAPVVSLEHPLGFGDEVPSLGFSKLGGSRGVSGAGVLAVLRCRQRLGEREETRRKCWNGGLG